MNKDQGFAFLDGYKPNDKEDYQTTIFDFEEGEFKDGN